MKGLVYKAFFNVNLSMPDYLEIHFKTASQFRKWLIRNHDKTDGIWMVFYKKHTKKENITYGYALDEALCFGWIDSLVRRIDDEYYVRKFTPRKNTKQWSEINKVKVLKLINDDRMTIHGLNKIHNYVEYGEVSWEKGPEKIDYKLIENTPKDIEEAFRIAEPAWTNFVKLSPGYRRDYLNWITQAKREETKIKRLDKAIFMLQQGLKPGMI
tara:strand:- start:68 stop:703 length:636 start_codon:yes stop_codon:yes gene_type:complete